MFSPLPSSRKSPGSRGPVRPSATTPPSRTQVRQPPSAETPTRAPRSTPPSGPGGSRAVTTPRSAGKAPSVRSEASPPQPPAEPAGVIDDHFRAEVLRTVLLQTAYTRRRLQNTAVAEKEKAESDLLRLWQLVNDAEEEEAALEDKYVALSEVIRTHCALKSLDDGLKSLVRATAPLAPFFEEYSELVSQRQATVHLAGGHHCDEAKLAGQLETIRRLVVNTEIKIDKQTYIPKALNASAEVFRNGEHIAAVLSNADALSSQANADVPRIRASAQSANAAQLENFLVALAGESASFKTPVLLA